MTSEDRIVAEAVIAFMHTFPGVRVLRTTRAVRAAVEALYTGPVE